MSFIITTESNSEIPFAWEDQNDFSVLRMPYTYNDKEYCYDLGRNTDLGAFFKQMRDGVTVTTAQRNPSEIVDYFEPYLKKGLDILHIAFSSKLSGTFNNEMIAREELLKHYPDRRIELIDTLAISMPLGQIVGVAFEMRRAGKSMDDIRDWVEANKMRSCSLFAVDSLEYLRRGGRITNTAAVFGTALQIKPILSVGSCGMIVPVSKIKGRKKAIKYILDKCAETIDKPEEQTVYVCHADCLDEAVLLKEKIEEVIRPRAVAINPIGPVIGAHCGPGTLAIVYFGRSRDELLEQA